MRYTILLIISLFAVSVFAQDTPTATDYLHVILDTETDEVHALSQFLPLRFPDLYLADFETLKAVYAHLGIDSGYADRRIWAQQLVHSWLRENQIDLSIEQQLVFEDFIIDVYPRDFDNDGVNEYLLDVYKNMPHDREFCYADSGIIDYLLVHQNDDTYEFIDIPFPWVGYWRSPGLVELKFEDITADGIPEWILIQSGSIGGGPGTGYVNHGELHILTLKENGLVELTPPYSYGNLQSTMHFETNTGIGCPIRPSSVEWTFINLDSDVPLEILQRQIYVDNWYCELEETRTFDWDGNLYTFKSSERTFSETRNCYQRYAVGAMWESNYEQAILLFERGLTLPAYKDSVADPDSLYWKPIFETLDAYYMAQLALAYIMTEQPEKASAILENLEAVSIKDFIDSLTANVNHPIAACFDAYTVFAQSFPSQHLGAIEELEIDQTPYYPERIGCDAPSLLEQVLASHSFTTDLTPTEQLEQLGIKVEKTLQVDLNHDQVDEWIIWTPVEPLFFRQQDDRYLISKTMIDRYRRAESIQVRMLPDETTALVYLNLHWLGDLPDWFDGYNRVGGIGGGFIECPIPENRYRRAGYASLWRMEEGQLVEFFNQETCATDFETLFPNGERSDSLVTAREVYDPNIEFGSGSEPEIYEWDNTTKTFVPPVTPTLLPTPYVDWSTPQFVTMYRSVLEALLDGNYANVRLMIDIETGESEEEKRFYRAFAFEKQNRPDEALAEYRRVYELAPESIWGKLAALHLGEE